MQESLLINYNQLKSELSRVLRKYGFSDQRAEQCAEIFAKNSLEGVYTHGVNRFIRFVGNIRDGYIKPDAVPTLVHSLGALEQWDGNLGPGPLNGVFAADRAIEIAAVNGIGMVGLANTNHWMRGGTYGWQAARKNCVLIAWTNTEANMPAWGATEARIGNNPFVIAVPFRDEAIVLDFAMTQFSYGRMEVFRSSGKKLPYPGGFDSGGNLTDDATEILESRRALPIGYWKGSGLSLLLDILAVILSGGKATYEITQSKVEYGVSQAFIAIDIQKLHNYPSIENSIHRIIADFKDSIPEKENMTIRYPGENILRTRQINMKSGIPLNHELWNAILSL